MFINFLNLIVLLFRVACSSEILKCGINSLINGNNYFILDKGSCYNLFENHSNILPKPLHRYFQRFPNTINLFRVISHSKIASYPYFTNASDFNNSISDYENYPGRNFKSKLLLEWKNIRPMEMNITLRGDGNNVVAWLTFRVRDTDDLESWFMKDNLIQCFPWKLEHVSSETFAYFSLKGNQNPAKRRFHISFPFVGQCYQDFGMLSIYDVVPEYCKYIPNEDIPLIGYVEHDSSPAHFEKYIKYAVSLEIMGIYNDTIQIYNRI